jgi:hypothetical protein
VDRLIVRASMEKEMYWGSTVILLINLDTFCFIIIYFDYIRILKTQIWKTCLLVFFVSWRSNNRFWELNKGLDRYKKMKIMKMKMRVSPALSIFPECFVKLYLPERDTVWEFIN